VVELIGTQDLKPCFWIPQ